MKHLLTLCCCLSLYAVTALAETGSCLTEPKQIDWEDGGVINEVLCGYNNGNIDTSYIQLINIPREMKQGCIKIEYAPVDSPQNDEDTLTLAPNEGVVLNKSRSPLTLDLDDEEGSQVSTIPIKTDNIHNQDYSLSISGESSSVNVNVKVNWEHENPDCDETAI
jgi:hypothetical protein